MFAAAPPPVSFAPFSIAHFGALLTITAFAVAAYISFRSPSRTKPREVLRWVLAAGFASAFLTHMLNRSLAERDWRWAVPLHLCDVSLIMAIFALVTLRRLPFEFAYFFGFGGTLQALATPDLAQGFPSWRYFAFFGAHGAVIVAVLFLIGAYNLRPTRGAIWRMIIAGNIYLAIAAIVNYFANTNFGYLREKPDAHSLLAYLGPWPWYILSLELLGVAIIALLYLPFWRVNKRGDTISLEETETLIPVSIGRHKSA